MKTMTAWRCTECKGFNVKRDAFVGVNTGEINSYDMLHCEDCEGECNTEEVQLVAVPDVLPVLDGVIRGSANGLKALHDAVTEVTTLAMALFNLSTNGGK